MISPEKSCCGTNATVIFSFFAQITAIFGILFSSGLILFSQFFTKHHSTIPGIISLLIYTFVLYGINKQRTAYLVPALTILGLYIVTSVIGVSLLTYRISTSKYNLDHFVDTKHEPIFVITMLLFFLAIVYAVFSFIVIYQARRYMLQQKSVPKSFGNILNETGHALP